MKKRTKIIAFLIAGVVLLAAALCVLYLSHTSGFYSEEQHLSRVLKRAEERYLGEESEYTGLDVYPLYNENDELKYMLIELKPQGFVYVKINSADFFLGMYTVDVIEEKMPNTWTPYRVVEGRKEVFTNEDGEPIRYFESHFKVAGIENERRYLLATRLSGEFIPAVKRGDQYLDLVDGERIEYEPGVYSKTYAAANISFIGKANFDL